MSYVAGLQSFVYQQQIQNNNVKSKTKRNFNGIGNPGNLVDLTLCINTFLDMYLGL